VNLEELVRAALSAQASAEPEEADAYDRFLRHRRRWAWRAAGSAVLAVALVFGLAVGGVWLVGGRHQGRVTGPATATGSYTATMVFVVPVKPGTDGTSPDGAQRLASTYAGLVLEDDSIAQAVARAVNREPAEVRRRLTAVNPANTALIRVTYRGNASEEALAGVRALQASLTGPKPVSRAVRPDSVIAVQEPRVTARP
jgi:hypothetical protein